MEVRLNSFALKHRRLRILQINRISLSKETRRSELTDLHLEGVLAAVLEPDALVVLVAALRPRVDQEPLLALHPVLADDDRAALPDALGRVRLEVARVLQQHRAAVHVHVLPLALRPTGELALAAPDTFKRIFLALDTSKLLVHARHSVRNFLHNGINDI